MRSNLKMLRKANAVAPAFEGHKEIDGCTEIKVEKVSWRRK